MENERNNSIERKVDRLIEIEEENSEAIKKMQKYQKIQNIFRIIYWLVLIGIALGAFYYFQPFVNSVFSDYESIKNSITSFNSKNPADPTMINNVLNIFKK